MTPLAPSVMAVTGDVPLIPVSRAFTKKYQAEASSQTPQSGPAMRNCSNLLVSRPNIGSAGGQPIASGKARQKTMPTNNTVAAALPSASPSPDTAGSAEGAAASGNIELCATSL